MLFFINKNTILKFNPFFGCKLAFVLKNNFHEKKSFILLVFFWQKVVVSVSRMKHKIEKKN